MPTAGRLGCRWWLLPCLVMAWNDTTRDAVLAAMAECDEVGQQQFLDRYGYREATAYHVEHEGRRYDSTAIVGVAHRYLPERLGAEPIESRALRPDEFSGGKATVVTHLEQLGFRVVEVRPPVWAWDELVLVCDLMASKGWTRLLEEHHDVIELSRLLRLLPLHPAEVRTEKFRSPGAVARKGENIRQWHADFGHRPNHGGTRDKEVHDAFVANPHEMHLLAVAIRTELLAGRLTDVPPADDGVDEGISEGSLLQRRHLARERNPTLRRKKIAEVLKLHGRLECEVCTFDFKQTYGERGDGFAEVHHAVPLHVTGLVKTRTSDLVVLCSNCHRMIHRGKQWLTPAELRALIKK
jgi:5-methylcytosine-specific restriction enzyme A